MLSLSFILPWIVEQRAALLLKHTPHRSVSFRSVHWLQINKSSLWHQWLFVGFILSGYRQPTPHSSWGLSGKWWRLCGGFWERRGAAQSDIQVVQGGFWRHRWEGIIRQNILLRFWWLKIKKYTCFIPLIASEMGAGSHERLSKEDQPSGCSFRRKDQSQLPPLRLELQQLPLSMHAILYLVCFYWAAFTCLQGEWIITWMRCTFALTRKNAF